MQTMLINQIANSKLSKQGRTTLTGIFEAQPTNTLVSFRGYTTPVGDAMQDQPFENAFNFRKSQELADTYLEHMKNQRQI